MHPRILLRYVINLLISGLGAYYCLVYYGVWVRPPLRKTSEESLLVLNNLIEQSVLEFGILIFVILITQALLTLLMQKWLDKDFFKNEFWIITTLNLLIMVSSLAFGALKCKSDLSDEIIRNFN